MMLVQDRVRIQLPNWLQSYKTLRLKQQKCLERIRHLSAALYRSRNQTSIVRNLVEYRRWLDFLKSLEKETPKMRFTDERQWQYGGLRTYYPLPKHVAMEPKAVKSVKLPKLKFHQVARKSYNVSRSDQKAAFKLPEGIDIDTSTQVTSRCVTYRSSNQSEHSGNTLLEDMRNSLERQETIPSKLSPRSVLNLPRIQTFITSVP